MIKSIKYRPILKDEMLHKKECYLGVSVSSPYIMSTKLPSILNWIYSNYGGCHILIGDYLHRINEYIFFGKNAKDAIDKSRLLGKLIQIQIENSLTQNTADSFNIVHWEDFITLNNQSFQDELKKIVTFYKEDSVFRKSIQSSSITYIEKLRKRGLLFIDKEEAIIKSIDYIIEEMAVFAVFASQGIGTQIYPGEVLNVLKEIINDNYPNFDSSLLQSTYVELKL